MRDETPPLLLVLVLVLEIELRIDYEDEDECKTPHGSNGRILKP